ncbi:MAG: sulfatase [Planctomycetaceae bacterium]|nr:sulfatase [Planctomycetaceae bacterium]
MCAVWRSGTPAAFGSEPSRPNVILILCDNLGYGDVGCFNPEAKQRTPRIDRMATEGMKFTDCYAAAAVCTPSRAALMTGCYPRRVGLDNTDPDGLVLRPVSQNGLNPKEITIAELLKGQGYATACIGKWHLGDQTPFLPTQQGFDYYLGIPYSDDMVAGKNRPEWPPLPLMENEKVIDAPVDRNLLTKRYTEQTIRFIEEHREGPFFIYLPHAMPGSTASPFASEAFRGKSANGPWGDSVEELDWSTGEILDALKRLDLDENTLVIWTNDNGAPAPDRRGGSNLPLKGNAYSVAEGGMRVPLIARWPGRIPAGTVCREVVTLMDMLPTLGRLAGADLPTDRVIDGHDIRPLMFAEPGATSPTGAFFYYYVNQIQAVRSGPWKLYLPQSGKKGEAGTLQLYNLVDDLRETKNLAGARADVVTRLERLLDRARVDLGETDRKGANVRPVGRFENPRPRVME